MVGKNVKIIQIAMRSFVFTLHTVSQARLNVFENKVRLPFAVWAKFKVSVSNIAAHYNQSRFVMCSVNCLKCRTFDEV